MFSPPLSHYRGAEERACDFIANDGNVKRVRLPFSFFLQNLNSFLVDNRFRRNDDLKDCVRRWLCELAVEMYEWRYMQNSYNVRTSIGMGLVVVLKNNLIYILFISELFISGDIDPDQI